jgi:hypothetical protein
MPESALDQFVQELGLPTKAGKIVVKNGKYFLALGTTRKEIPTTLATESELAKMAGKPVVAITSGRSIVAIVAEGARKPWRPQCFTCYVPAPDFRKQVDPELRKMVIDKFLAAGVLTGRQAETLSQITTSR